MANMIYIVYSIDYPVIGSKIKGSLSESGTLERDNQSGISFIISHSRR